ncbi:ADP-ribosyl-[dinitrogen reductase] hydrolase [Aromatoleum diolicum]|uniref:ADP-ribosyl-[dinitrogen reductase] hydrolase n=1 Tax=Aromatoleum diolicum TaxID=75796 RepID=A0ABX1Q5Q6_9RHOO|nr:ADP-ribosyl-[dinitrogen reductase] hydrolase [Aromatoleum diolicum]NMG73318.1 ADP-ribosyl-[dinitrogen reductase] hydrolase [Aromatoleum diolicum]
MNSAAQASLHSRALGAYLGLAVGDALGATVEFLTPNEIRQQYGELRDIVGGGWLRLKAGQVTDDTQMSLALGAAILESGGWDLRNIAAHWLAWLKSKPIDVGNTCRRGLVRYGRDGSLAGAFSDGDAGNGALMRNLPAILFAFRDAERLARCAIEQAHVTHHHPLSDAATLSFARMLADLLHGGHWRDNLQQTRRTALALVEAHRQFRFDPYPKRATGYVVDTVQTVLHAFFSTDSFESCVITTVNWGGDADTTGAIAGMLAGAHYGVEAIPARWLRRLDGAVRREIEHQAPALLALGASLVEAPDGA